MGRRDARLTRRSETVRRSGLAPGRTQSTGSQLGHKRIATDALALASSGEAGPAQVLSGGSSGWTGLSCADLRLSSTVGRQSEWYTARRRDGGVDVTTTVTAAAGTQKQAIQVRPAVPVAQIGRPSL